MNLTESLVLLAASVGLLFFIRGRDGESHRILRKFSLGSGPNGRHDRIVAVRWRPHGHRDKSELAALEIFLFCHPSKRPRLAHGMGVARLTDLPAEWSRQREMLGFPSH